VCVCVCVCVCTDDFGRVHHQQEHFFLFSASVKEFDFEDVPHDFGCERAGEHVRRPTCVRFERV
jgi:hypothetical protein